MTEIAAVVFAVLAGVVVVFQIALAFGAPWGEFAMGGQFRGAFPPAMRVVAVGSAVVVALMGAMVLARAGLAFERWADASVWGVWIVVGYSVAGLVMNLITHSRRERMVWAPVVAIMLVCSLVVALS